MNDLIYKAEGIKKSYTLGGQTLKILRGAELSIQRGEMLGIVGSSGAGKSTLLHILGLLDRPDSGSISFEGTPVDFTARAVNARLRNERIGFVFQFYHLLPEFNALENVLLSPMLGKGPLAWFSARKAAREKAAALLDSLGLGGRLRHKPPQLSGGERQRVAIARALILDPVLLFCDEPTGNLDEKTSSTIVDLLFRINAQARQTMVLVTHNERLATRMPRLLRLQDGILRQVSSSETVV